jgi:hypothetical protein
MHKTNNVKREVAAMAIVSLMMALKIWIGIHLYQNWRLREAAAGRFVSRDSETE